MTQHWLSKERVRLYSLALVVVYVGWAFILIGRSYGGIDASGKPLGFDFIAFWGASRLALSGNPAGAYDPHTLLQAERAALPGLGEGPLGPWQYPPTFYLLVMPLALLPYFLSYFAFVGSTFAALAVVVRRIVATQDLPMRPAWLPLLGFPAVMINAFEGQNGFLTAALIGTALLLLGARPALAGVAIGLLTIKPHLGVLMPLALLCGGHWRTLLYAGLTAAGFIAVSVAVLGGDTLSGFFARLPEVAGWVTEGKMPLAKMPTFFSFARQLGMSAQYAYILHGAVALSAAGVVAWTWLKCRDTALRSAILLVGTLLISPYLFDYDLVWLALAIAWFTGYAIRWGWLSWEREYLVLVWLLPLIMLLTNHVLNQQPAPLVLLGFLMVLLRRAVGDVGDAQGGGAQSVSPPAEESTDDRA